MKENHLLYKDECYEIIGACMEVHRELGCGFLEAVYQEALELEFKIAGLPYSKETPITIVYKNIPLKKGYIADFICFNNIIIELKAVDELDSKHVSQVLNYLKATGYKLGILVNFGSESLAFKRIVR
jgi:GxxExxY protein